jgi:hypothetical protein
MRVLILSFSEHCERAGAKRGLIGLRWLRQAGFYMRMPIISNVGGQLMLYRRPQHRRNAAHGIHDLRVRHAFEGVDQLSQLMDEYLYGDRDLVTCSAVIVQQWIGVLRLRSLREYISCSRNPGCGDIGSS